VLVQSLLVLTIPLGEVLLRLPAKEAYIIPMRATASFKRPEEAHLPTTDNGLLITLLILTHLAPFTMQENFYQA
jgi:hypothetical protein